MPGVTATSINNCMLKAAANLTAQIAARWHTPTDKPLDYQRILEFALFGFVGAQVGYRWQLLLEDLFPVRHLPGEKSSSAALAREKVLEPGVPATNVDVPPPPPTGAASDGVDGKGGGGGGGSGIGARIGGLGAGIDWRNLALKILADQTVGLTMMIVIFLVITHAFRVPDPLYVMEAIQQKSWKLVKAGWTIWPAVAVVQFLWVPVRWRMILSGVVGFGWNIFLSIVALSHGHPPPPPLPPKSG